LLSAADPLPFRPRRVVVAGTSGSGKTTLARRVATALALPHVDIDGLYHGPGWVPRETFLDDVRAFVSQPSWATEWQYGAARPLLADRADLFLWLDLPRRTVMRQVILRTVTRRVRRVELWNGNREPPLRAFFTDPEHIVRWAWNTHHKTPSRIAALLEERPDLTVVRLPSRAAVSRWCDGPLRQARDKP
jgi:adenylate kinase family enzyme